MNKENFTKNWILDKKKDFPSVDPGILEKSIYALELVENLKTEGLEFIFKGGTSLLLLLEDPKRLSIDIDILTREEESNIEKALSGITKRGIFYEWQEDPRTNRGIPKKHYKLSFKSVINPHAESYILLDVLFADSPYSKLSEKEVKNIFIESDSKVKITVPTINGLLGDKLTAFAANTTGIPFGIGKEMEINKQLFDIGIIYDKADDIKEIQEVFENSILNEAGYRKKKITSEEVIQDLFDLSFLISQIRLKKSISNEITKEFEVGIRKLQSHLLIGNYNIDYAKINSSRCALITQLFGNKADIKESAKFDLTKITEEVLEGDLQILNKLKILSPEAYYYWQQVQKIRLKGS